MTTRHGARPIRMGRIVFQATKPLPQLAGEVRGSHDEPPFEEFPEAVLDRLMDHLQGSLPDQDYVAFALGDSE